MTAAEALLAAYIIVAFAFSCVAAWWTARRARRKGRTVWLWAILGFTFGILAVGAIALLPPVDAGARRSA